MMEEHTFQWSFLLWQNCKHPLVKNRWRAHISLNFSLCLQKRLHPPVTCAWSAWRRTRARWSGPRAGTMAAARWPATSSSTETTAAATGSRSTPSLHAPTAPPYAVSSTTRTTTSGCLPRTRSAAAILVNCRAPSDHSSPMVSPAPILVSKTQLFSLSRAFLENV